MIIEKQAYQAKDLTNLLSISLTTAYELMHNIEFPSVRIGKKYVVRKSDFEEWYAKQRKKVI